ncbi:MAG TPA: hypothetical protein VD788_17785 [Candidatus Polarisedimenticolaceae bacterium]|nr:hypothetical protein [Candidatus Polarisedimenticolaceae bacterium]
MALRGTLGLLLVWLPFATVHAEGHQLVERWREAEFTPRKFSKVIVLAVTDDRQLRKTFENRFVSHLRGQQIECTTSYAIAPDLTGIDEAERRVIVDTVEAEKIDGVIAIRAVPLIGLDEQQWAEQWRERINRRQSLAETIEQSLPLAETKAKRYGIEVELWAVPDAGRVWAARTNPYTRDEMRKGAAEFVQFTLYALDIEDLMKRGAAAGEDSNAKP